MVVAIVVSACGVFGCCCCCCCYCFPFAALSSVFIFIIYFYSRIVELYGLSLLLKQFHLNNITAFLLNINSFRLSSQIACGFYCCLYCTLHTSTITSAIEPPIIMRTCAHVCARVCDIHGDGFTSFFLLSAISYFSVFYHTHTTNTLRCGFSLPLSRSHYSVVAMIISCVSYHYWNTYSILACSEMHVI